MSAEPPTRRGGSGAKRDPWSVRRLPIKLRVTLVFAAAMAVVLAGVGFFLHSQLRSRLDESIDNGLRSRAGDVAVLVRGSEEGVRQAGRQSLVESDESFAQVLTPSGHVLGSTPQLGGQAVLSVAEIRQAESSTRTFFEHPSAPGIEGAARLLATPTVTDRDDEGSDGQVVVVVGSSLGDRDEALANLATLLAIGGPIALLLASLAGYAALALALRPVEAMRRRAAEISASEPHERLPAPAGDDELARLGTTLNAMLERLEAALERERRFVDDAAHELRTPLALHKTELELALRYAAGEAELRAAISSAAGEIDRLVQLAEDLLVVARTQEGELAIAREPVSAADLFATVGERFHARAAEAGRTLDADGPVDAGVIGDRLRLEQALTSLVDNALRHGDGEVRMWARRNGEVVELHVSDGGPGFPPDFISHAFERFSRADEARGRGGTGLGLAIVETIARAHGGRARATNPPGGGADVWIELPSSSFHDGSVEPRA
jgi:two-component system, OmpR family, sensor kinase